MTKKGKYSPVLHHNGTVTLWSVYEQRWVTVSQARTIPDKEWSALSDQDQARLWRFFGKHGTA